MDLPKSDLPLHVQDELRQLHEENARLKALLAQHGIAWEGSITPDLVAVPQELAPVPSQFTIEEKIVLFRRLFRGREDVYPRRWESAKGASGYAPVCGHEWKPGLCCKPKVKCGDCAHRLLLPLTNQVFYDHLAGQHTIGVYPLLPDEGIEKLEIILPDAFWHELISFEEMDSETKAAKKTQKIDNGIDAQKKVFSIPPDQWLKINEELSKKQILSPKEVSILQVACQMPNRIPSEKQSIILLDIYEKAKSEGLFTL